MRIPMIGLTPLWDEKLQSLWMLPGYMDSLVRAGAAPVMLPLTADRDMLVQLAEALDGFLFTGGQDVSPGLYGQEATLSEELCAARDAMEGILFEVAVMKRGKPAFGICRGLQFINVALGGTLYQDIQARRNNALDHQQKPPYDQPSHGARVLPDTPLHALLGRDEIRVNSCHHQAICDLADELTAMALAEDGLIEAVYMPGKPFVWAVQWHPEFAPAQETSRKLFEAFVRACAG